MWRLVQRDPDGNKHAINGVYHKIPPERVVFTFEYEGMPGHVFLETVTFEEQDSKTLMVDTAVFQSVDDRHGMLASVMEAGAVETMDRFAELLEKT